VCEPPISYINKCTIDTHSWSPTKEIMKASTFTGKVSFTVRGYFKYPLLWWYDIFISQFDLTNFFIQYSFKNKWALNNDIKSEKAICFFPLNYQTVERKLLYFLCLKEYWSSHYMCRLFWGISWFKQKLDLKCFWLHLLKIFIKHSNMMGFAVFHTGKMFE
jgi:hypothetical protein